MRSRLVTLVAVGIAASVVASTAVGPVPSVQAEEKSVALNAQTLSPTERRFAPFDHPLSIRDALDLAASRSVTIVGLRIENSTALGEFSTSEGFTVEQYSSWFQREFGVIPQATGWLIERQRLFDAAGAPVAPPDEPTVPTGRPEFRASPLVNESAATDLDKRSATFDQSPGGLAPVAPLASSNRWQPNVVEVDIEEDAYNHGIQFRQYAFWGNGASPVNKPNDFGMEFQVDLYNGRGGTRQVANTECPSDYKSAFIAENRNYKLWGVSTGKTNLNAAVGAYADYNDLFDSCGKNSIAVGLRYPDKIPQFAPGKYSILISILAPRGSRASSELSGDVQLVDQLGCLQMPWLPYTDCMGLGSSLAPPGYDLHRGTLASKRRWVANPARCWVSAGSGQSTPIPVIPSSPTGCFVF